MQDLSHLLTASRSAIQAEEAAFQATQQKDDALHVLTTTLCEQEMRTIADTKEHVRLMEGDMAKTRLDLTIPSNLSPLLQAEWLLKEALGELDETTLSKDTFVIALSNVTPMQVEKALEAIRAEKGTVSMAVRYSTKHRTNAQDFKEILNRLAVIKTTRNIGEILMLREPYKSYFEKASKEAEIRIARNV